METSKLPQESLRARLKAAKGGRRRPRKVYHLEVPPPHRIRDIEDIDVADVLAIYHAHREAIYAERGSPQTEITEFADRIGRLNDFFGGKMLAEVNAQSCGHYVRARGRPGGVRRDLEDLRAAINHAREGLHRGVVRVALPTKGPGRDRWLSRNEAAALLWACWRYREVQTRHRGSFKNQKSRRANARFVTLHGLFDRSLYGHSRRRDRVGVPISREWPIIRGSRKRHLLSVSPRAASDQEATTANPNS
jgi:hypothetical protein